MWLKPLAIASLALLLGSVSAPTEVLADPPSWAPAHGWRKQKNVDKREERAERRETRALNLRNPDATTTDLNRSQIRKNDRADRREALADIRREERARIRQAELDQIRRENRALRRQQALVPYR